MSPFSGRLCLRSPPCTSKVTRSTLLGFLGLARSCGPGRCECVGSRLPLSARGGKRDRLEVKCLEAGERAVLSFSFLSFLVLF